MPVWTWYWLAPSASWPPYGFADAFAVPLAGPGGLRDQRHAGDAAQALEAIRSHGVPRCHVRLQSADQLGSQPSSHRALRKVSDAGERQAANPESSNAGLPIHSLVSDPHGGQVPAAPAGGLAGCFSLLWVSLRLTGPPGHLFCGRWRSFWRTWTTPGVAQT